MNTCLKPVFMSFSHLQSSPCHSVNKLCSTLTPWAASRQAPLSSTVFQSLLRSMSIESVMLSNHLILCCPFLLSPSVFPSIQVFSSGLALRIRRPEYWSFSFSSSLFNEYPGLVSFRIK